MLGEARTYRWCQASTTSKFSWPLSRSISRQLRKWSSSRSWISAGSSNMLMLSSTIAMLSRLRSRRATSRRSRKRRASAPRVPCPRRTFRDTRAPPRASSYPAHPPGRGVEVRTTSGKLMMRAHFSGVAVCAPSHGDTFIACCRAPRVERASHCSFEADLCRECVSHRV